MNDNSTTAQYLYSRAWCALLAGDPGRARDDWLKAAATSRTGMGEARTLAARSALWQGDETALTIDLDDMARLGEYGRTVEAVRLSLAAGASGLRGDISQAVRMFRDARRTLAELDLPWQEALACLDMAHALPIDAPETAEARQRAREILERLGAVALLRQLDRLAEGSQPTPSRARAAEETAVTSDLG